MANSEDFYYEIYTIVHNKGIHEKFYKQLDKMKFQDKHKYKTNRDLWEYAYRKILLEELNRK